MTEAPPPKSPRSLVSVALVQLGWLTSGPRRCRRDDSVHEYARSCHWLFLCLLRHRGRATQGLYSLSGKTSYREISWSLEATRLDVIMVVSLWHLTGTSAAALPMCLLNFRAIGKVQTRISWLRGFTRSYSKTSYRLVNRGPGTRVSPYKSVTISYPWHITTHVLKTLGVVLLHPRCGHIKLTTVGHVWLKRLA